MEAIRPAVRPCYLLRPGGKRCSASKEEFKLVTLPNQGDAKDGALGLIDDVLDALRAWCDPLIAVVSRADAQRLVPAGAVEWSDELHTEVLAAVQYRQRSTIEADDAFVQVMACGVQTHKQEVFVVVRRPPRGRTPSRRDDTALVWRGCHLVRAASGMLTLDDFREQLKMRLRDDLHLGDLPATPEPRGIVWDPEGEEPRHMAVVFRVDVSDKLAEWLDEKTFKTNGKGYRLESSFAEVSELSAAKVREKGYTVEGWSRRILDEGWLP